MNVDPQMAAGARDEELDRLARLVPDGIGYQFAREQRRHVRVDGYAPGVDGCPDMAACFGRSGRSYREREAERPSQGRADRRDRVHLRFLTEGVGPAWPRKSSLRAQPGLSVQTPGT